MCMVDSTDYVIVSTTLDNADAADELARKIVEAKLAACVQRSEVKSTYRWDGEVKTSAEYKLEAKTVTELSHKIIHFIKDNHSYDLPEVLVTPIMSGDHEYLHWLESSTSAPE